VGQVVDACLHVVRESVGTEEIAAPDLASGGKVALACEGDELKVLSAHDGGQAYGPRAALASGLRAMQPCKNQNKRAAAVMRPSHGQRHERRA
jgi:hypothetical protein